MPCRLIENNEAISGFEIVEFRNFPEYYYLITIINILIKMAVPFLKNRKSQIK